MTFFCIMHMAAVKRRQICSPTKKVPCIYKVVEIFPFVADSRPNRSTYIDN